MKWLIMLWVAIIATTAAFAQKSKMNSTNIAAPVQIQNACPVQTEMCPFCNSNFSKKEQMKMDVMKIYTCSMHTQVVSIVKKDSTKCPDCKTELVVDRRSSKQPGTATKCLMDADRNSAKTGKCPICTMDLNTTKG